MTNAIIVIIGIATLTITCWVLVESIRTRKTSDAQYKLATEPDFELFVTMPNRDPLVINCKNKGVPVNDFRIFLENNPLNVTIESGSIREEYSYNIEIPRSLIMDNLNIILRISYQDKAKITCSRNYIYDPENNEIRPA